MKPESTHTPSALPAPSLRNPAPRARLAAVAGCAALVAALSPAAVAQAEDGAKGDRPTAVVMVNFTDKKIDQPDQVRKNAESMYFGTDTQGTLNSYYDELTGGGFRFTPVDAEKPVIGPVDLDIAETCESGAINTATQKQLTAMGLERGRQYESLSMILPPVDCGWSGLGSVGGPYTWIPQSAVDQGVLVHEFGHNFGYAHHMRLRCTNGDLLGNCAEDGNGKKTPMGGAGPSFGLTAPEMMLQKWIADDELKTVEKSGTFQLRSLHGSGTGLRALEIPLNDTNKLVVEYRHASGSMDELVEGVHAYKVTDGKYGTAPLVDVTPDADADATKDNPLDADAITELTDTASRLSVEVKKSGGGSATVAVSLDGKPAPAAAGNQVSEQGERTQDAAADTGSGTDKGTEKGTEKTPESGKAPGENLAATGGNSATPIVAGAGGALVLLGGATVFALRRRGNRA